MYISMSVCVVLKRKGHFNLVSGRRSFGIFIWNTHNYLQSFTFALIMLNTQRQEKTLLSVSNVPFVIQCSDLLLYSAVRIRSAVWRIKCATADRSYSLKLQGLERNGKDPMLWPVKLQIQLSFVEWHSWHSKWTPSVCSIKGSLWPITICNYNCLNIGLFHSSAVFYTFICYQLNEFIHSP